MSNTFTTKIDIHLAKKLKSDLENQGFSIENPRYTVFSAKKKGVICTLYESGSLVVQGKDKDEFIEFYLEPEILKDFRFSHQEAYIDFKSRIGVDEAGKGDFFGPLCIAGIFADEPMIRYLIDLGVMDSKKIADKKVIKLAKQIREKMPYSIVKLFPLKYNELYSKFKNLNTLLGWGHATVITELFEKTGCKNVIIDQFASKFVVENALSQKKVGVDLLQRHKGEEDIVVAGASILARAAFLEGLEKLSAEFEIDLLKGASKAVLDVGRAFIIKHDLNTLKHVAKTHFKTYTELTC